jgi:glucokinase
MASTSYPRLLGDVGGTNARFALQEAPGGAPQRVRSYRAQEHATFADAIRTYLADEGLKGVSLAAIGIANPITGDHVKMTNHHWAFSIEQTRLALGLQRMLVLNDFQALALSLPALSPDERVQVGGGEPEPGKPLALIGPGTGLGVSGLLWSADRRTQIALEGEGGHVSLSAATDEEEGVIEILRQRFGHVSAERALSGQGLENLHDALGRMEGSAPAPLPAADITARALEGSDPLCNRVLAMFCALLGGVAGNLALTLGARGGVYIGGGIVPRLGGLLAASAFRERFEQKGRMRAFLQPIPVYVIKASVSPALVGAARALEHADASGA